jgi:hypothetical protein
MLLRSRRIAPERLRWRCRRRPATAEAVHDLRALVPPAGSLTPLRDTRRETTVKVHVGEISVETPSGYKVSARDLSVEVVVPRPYKGPGVA